MDDSIKEDVLALLSFYIKHEMDNERRFKEDQTNCKLKVCLFVHHNDHFEKEGRDKLIVHTKLKQTQRISENDLTVSSDVFYIKSQKVSHQAPNTSDSTAEHCHKTTIDTIVTKTHCDCETVFKTFIENTHDGKTNKIRKAFTREKIKCQHSVEGKSTLHRHQSDISNDNETIRPHQAIPTEAANIQSGSKKLNRKSSGKGKKELANTKVTNKKPSAQGIKEAKISKSDSKATTKTSSSKGYKELHKDASTSKDKPTILQKLKKAFSINTKTRALSILSLFVESPTANRKKSVISRRFFTEDFEMERKKPTDIIAEIYMDSTETKTFKIIEDDIKFIDEDEDDDTTCIVLDDENMEDESYFQFDPEDFNQLEMRTTDSSCDCESRRHKTIFQYIMSTLNGIKFNCQALSTFDDKTLHFQDCRMSPYYLSPKTPKADRKKSVAALSSYYCLGSILDNIKLENEINCTMETINYFIECNTYDSYEKGLDTVLDPAKTLENLILFFYLTRVIIKQTDDPTDSGNEVYRNIMDFSKQYIIKHYIPVIKEMGGIFQYPTETSDQMNQDELQTRIEKIYETLKSDLTKCKESGIEKLMKVSLLTNVTDFLDLYDGSLRIKIKELHVLHNVPNNESVSLNCLCASINIVNLLIDQIDVIGSSRIISRFFSYLGDFHCQDKSNRIARRMQEMILYCLCNYYDNACRRQLKLIYCDVQWRDALESCFFQNQDSNKIKLSAAIVLSFNYHQMDPLKYQQTVQDYLTNIKSTYIHKETDKYIGIRGDLIAAAIRKFPQRIL